MVVSFRPAAPGGLSLLRQAMSTQWIWSAGINIVPLSKGDTNKVVFCEQFTGSLCVFIFVSLWVAKTFVSYWASP